MLQLGRLLSVLLIMLALPAWAQEIPPQLRDWQAWVLHDPAACLPLMRGVVCGRVN